MDFFQQRTNDVLLISTWKMFWIHFIYMFHRWYKVFNYGKWIRQLTSNMVNLSWGNLRWVIVSFLRHHNQSLHQVKISCQLTQFLTYCEEHIFLLHIYRVTQNNFFKLFLIDPGMIQGRIKYRWIQTSHKHCFSLF